MMNILKIALTLLTVVLGLRALTGWTHSKCQSLTTKTKAIRTTAFTMSLIATLSVVTPALSLIRQRFADRDSGDGGPAEVLTATLADEDTTAAAFEAVNLTREQALSILDGFKLLFDDSSLSTRAEERLTAIKALGEEEFTGSVSLPLPAEYISKVKTGTLTEDDLREMRKIIYRSIIANPVMLDMVIQGLNQLPEAMKNNSDWLTAALQRHDERYALRRVTDTEDKSIGLDLFLEKGPDRRTLFVSEETQMLAARVIVLLDQMDLVGVQRLTSSKNWENAWVGEASLTRTQLAVTQESREALVFVLKDKGGTSAVKLGFNIFDQRLEFFEPQSTPVAPTPAPSTPTPTTPSTPTPAPKPTTPVTPKPQQPTPTIPTTPTNPKPTEPTPQPETADVTYKLIDRTTGNKLSNNNYAKRNQVVGTKVTFEPPEMNGFIAEQSCIETIVPKGGCEVPVYYNPVTYTATINYIDSTTNKNIATSFVKDRMKNGDSVSRTSPDIPGYKLQDSRQEEVTINITNHDETIDVKYDPITNPKVYVKLVNEKGKEIDREIVREVPYGDDFYLKAPDLSDRGYYDPNPEEIDIDNVIKDEYRTIRYRTRTNIPGPGPGDGNGAKDPDKDPVNTPKPDGSGGSNADIGGGPNKPDDGAGNYQPTEPPINNYPAQGSDKDPSTDKNVNGGYDPTPVTPDIKGDGSGKHEGSGPSNGQKPDRPIIDPNGGHTDNGDAPAKNEIPVHGNTVTDLGGNNSGNSGSSNWGSNSGSSGSSGGSSSSSGSSGGSSGGGAVSSPSQEPDNTVSIAVPD